MSMIWRSRRLRLRCPSLRIVCMLQKQQHGAKIAWRTEAVKGEYNKWGMWLTQVIGSGISLVGRSPWTAADALVRLLAGRPGGRPRARAPVPHSSPERGLPESSTYPVSTIKDRAALASDRAAAIEA